MKIACMIYAPMDKMGGAQVFAFNLLGKLHESGHDVTLYLTDCSYKELQSKMKKCPFRIEPLFFIETARLSMYAPFLIRKIIRGIQKREKYDLWQVIGAYPAGFVASALSGIVPLVLRTHGDDIQKDQALNYGARLDSAKEKRIRETLDSMDRLIAMTRNMYDCYTELQVPPEKIVEIPNTVNLKRFSIPVDRSATRRRYGIPEDRTLLVTVGRYHIKKGHDLIPEIADRLRQRRIDFKWLLIGNGLENLRGEINQKGLFGYFILKEEIGMTDLFGEQGEINVPNHELIALLKCSDIFVFPTRLEGFPMVLIEAMAAGIPVATTNSPGVREVVTHNKTALLSEIDDVGSMASNIGRLIDDYGLRDHLVEEGRKELFKYDRDNVADQYMKVYTQLVNNNKDRINLAGDPSVTGVGQIPLFGKEG
ncbi:MAG: glycosyltransferase family 4 protein [Nitrospirae bacterium]|nr:glycosyltransferase family 4 protein [Nitrospirota bacterium]